MAKKTYWELLKDPRWQKKRLEVLNDANWTCEKCKSADKTLHVHHKLYEKGLKPWEYENELLQCLCETCHTMEEYHKGEFNGAVHDLLLMGFDYEDLYEFIIQLPNNG